MVELQTESKMVGDAGQALCSCGCTKSAGHRRNHRTEARPQEGSTRGLSRDPVRSRKEFFVKTNGLRWIALMLLGEGSLGQPGVGPTLFDGAGTLRALSSGARDAT